MIGPAKDLLQQPLHSVAELSAADIPVEPGVYVWYRRGRLFYVGESHRGLRSRLWGNHLRGNARGSTLRNKVAKAYGFEPIGFRKYGKEAEDAITAKLRECEVRFLALDRDEISAAQAELIRSLDPPMNDHPGEWPRWRIIEVRRILAIEAATHPEPTQALLDEPDIDESPPLEAQPRWHIVERKLEELAQSSTWFPTITGKPNRIVDYEPGRRVLVETEAGTNWVQVSWIKTHWETLTTAGEVTRSDVLQPGRRSAFMLALFQQIPGVDVVPGRPARVRIRARQAEPE